jgi:ribonuclease HI/transposase InsO family protein
VELMGETLSFAPQKAIKSQILVDFLAEWTDTQLPTAPIQPKLWTKYFDGSLMKTGAGAGLLFISPLGKHVRYVLRLHFPASNNVVEYEALVNGLRIAVELGVQRLDARGDSQLVIDQVMKNSHCRDQKMEAYCDEVWRLEDKFYGLELNHVAQRYNETADELAKIASRRKTVPPNVFSRDIYQPSVKINDTPEPEGTSAQPEVPSAAEGEALRVEGERNGDTPVPNWQTPYLEYLLRGELPLDKAKARQLARRAKSFVLLGDEKELYHHSPSGILQRCISVAQGQELLQEINLGACGHHAVPRTLVGNAFRQGFYWPTAVADATRIVCSWRGCQFYVRQTHLPAQALQTIPITWSFVVWGLDLVGPLQKAPKGFTHLLVAIDKFSKWIEVRPLTSIRSEQAMAFFTNIIHRFGIPNSIITDNGTQFTGKKFLDFCEDHHIHVDWATVAHPMTNGQVERGNDMILQGLKPRIYNDLNKFGKRWIKELPSCGLESEDDAEPSHGFLAVFPSLWGQGHLTHRPGIRFPEDKGLRQPKQPDQSRGFIGPAGRGSGRGLTTLGAVSAVSATLPCLKGSAPRLPSGRLGTSATTRRPRTPQAYSSLGRAIHHRQDFEARDIQAGQRSRRGLQQRLEHRTAMSLLPLKCFKSFMYLTLLYMHK